MAAKQISENKVVKTPVNQPDDEGRLRAPQIIKRAMPTRPSSRPLVPPAARTSKVHDANIDTIARLESEQEERLSHTDRLSEAIGEFAGTTTFVALQLVWVSGWILINSGLFASFPPFDPFPFPLLSMILALEAVVLTGFVLIRQNRMSKKADQRSHLDLQINLLAEKEATKVIQLLQRISRHMGIERDVSDRESRELGKDTEVEDLARDLRKNLGNDCRT